MPTSLITFFIHLLSIARCPLPLPLTLIQTVSQPEADLVKSAAEELKLFLRRGDEMRTGIFLQGLYVFFPCFGGSVSHLAWCRVVVTRSLGPDVSIMINGGV